MPDPQNKSSQKGLSSSTKLVIGLCLGCLALLTLFFIGSALFGRLFFKNDISPGLEKSLEESSEEPELNGEVGEPSFKTGTQIPETFPDDIPLYPGAKVIQSIEVGGALQVAIQTSDNINEVMTYYKEEMENNGWEEEASFEFEESQTRSYSKEEKRSSVIAVDVDETERTTTISITYEAQR